jgi:type I restriction enzyme S subunit
MNDREQQGGPQGWKRMTLGKALPIHYGKARNEKYGTVREGTPVYGSSGRIDTFKRALTVGPSLIIGRKGTVGATYYCPEPCWPIDTVYFAETSANEDLRFFKYLLDHLQLGRMDRSTAVPGLSRDDYNATEVFIPGVDQQRLIVAEIEKQFSRLDEAVANLKRVKANLKRYKAAVLKAAVEGKLTEDWRKQHPDIEPASKLLERILAERRAKLGGKKEGFLPADGDPPAESPDGWIICSIDQVAECLDGKRVPVNKAERVRRGGDIPYYGANGQAGVIDNYIFDEPLVLVVEDETFTGRTQAFSYVIQGKSWVNNHAHVLRATAAIDVAYLNYALAHYPFTPRTTGSTGRRKLTQKGLMSAPFLLPPIAEQIQIITEVERRLSVIDELEAAIKANLTRADRLRQVVLHQAFAGRLITTEQVSLSSSR